MPNKSQHQKAITAARELCDTLLGINRSSLKEEVKLKFSDREVCKYTLCGICPHTLFNQTKSDLGPSPYSIYGLTNPRLAGPIKEWNSLPQREKDKYGYEYKTMVFLQQLVRKCDQKIENSKKRLEAEERPATMADLNEDDKAKLIDITTKIQEKTDEAEKYGEDNNANEALRIMKEIDLLNKQRLAITQGVSAASAGIKQNESKLIVCTVTGHYYSSLDGEERMDLYFQGKQYRGWKHLREFLKVMEKNNPPRGLREYEERVARDNSRFGSSSSSRNYGSGRSGGGNYGRGDGGRGYGGGRDGGRRDFKRQKREEWTCSSCGVSNFMDRFNCRRCGAPKVTPKVTATFMSRSGGNGGGGGGGGGGYQDRRSGGGGGRRGGGGGGGRSNNPNHTQLGTRRGGDSYSRDGNDSYRRGGGGGYSERGAPRQRRW